jgi:hypothetical protein
VYTILNFGTVKNPQTTRSWNQAAAQNLVLVWVDSNIDADDADAKHVYAQLQSIISSSTTYSAADDAVEFIKKSDKESIILVTSGTLGMQLVPRIHELDQVKSIYLFCGKPSAHLEWITQWKKIK